MEERFEVLCIWLLIKCFERLGIKIIHTGEPDDGKDIIIEVCGFKIAIICASWTNKPNHQNGPKSTTSDIDHFNSNGVVKKKEIIYRNNQSIMIIILKKKWKNMTVRTFWTFIMISGFFAILAVGYLMVIILVVIIQTLVYKEVIALTHVPSKEKKLPWFKTLNWYFLVSTNYFLYGESIIYYFKKAVLVDAFLLPFATLISFTLYCIGFVLFVANLKKGYYKFQFTQFIWTHMTLLIVVCQNHFIVNNIFEGLIWFLLPVSLVICNDIFAYIFGFFLGKTPLIKLSPKKTWEGFVGGWISTIIFGFFWASLLMRWDYLICPVSKDLSASAWFGMTCEPNPVFIQQSYQLSPWLSSLLRRFTFTDIRTIWIAPFQWHVLVMACFASLIAPFGGFFASGVKRAFNLKDFGQSIPGHGGITDRMDCQFLMGLFSYMYYRSFIKTTSLSVGAVLQSIVNSLKPSEQLELLDSLQQYLIGQGLVEEGKVACVSTV